MKNVTMQEAVEVLKEAKAASVAVELFAGINQRTYIEVDREMLIRKLEYYIRRGRTLLVPLSFENGHCRINTKVVDN